LVGIPEEEITGIAVVMVSILLPFSYKIMVIALIGLMLF